MSLIEVPIVAPPAWPQVRAQLDAADLSIGEALYVAKALLETALSGVDIDVRQAVLAGFVRALRAQGGVRGDSIASNPRSA